MSESIPGPLEPTSDERTMATLAQVLQLVGWWIAPLVIFLVKRDSRFVSFHALQALLLQVIWMAFGVALTVGWMAIIFSTVAFHPHGSNAPPPPVFLLFPLFFLGWMFVWAGMLVIAIVYGIKASRGEWAAYPVIGPPARRILKIAPDGTPLPA